MVADTPSLRIAVVGAGNIGSAFAFQLASAGSHAVTVVARPGSPRLLQLQRDGGVVGIAGDRAQLRVTDTLDEQIPYDLVIVTLMAHQVNTVLPAIVRSAARCILLMFNTFEPERLSAAIGRDRCAFGMPFVQALVDTHGRLKVTIGAAGQKTIMDRQRWVDVFAAAGLPAALEPDMPLWLRCHAPLCVAFQSVCVAGVRRGGGATWAEARSAARGMRAGFGLIQALGHDIYPAGKRRLAGMPVYAVAPMLWLVSRNRAFRELLATGEAECGALIDTMLSTASRAASSADVAAIGAMKPADRKAE